MIVYWIREPHHSDIYSEGYVGVTKKPLRERIREHKKNKKNSIVARMIRARSDLVASVVHDSLEEKDAYFIEMTYRPVAGIGWNLQRGGEKGVESDWYDNPENSIKHSMKTSEGTRRGIAAKDTREARAERARQNHKKHSQKYKEAAKGERNPRAILKEFQVVEIKYRLLPSGMSVSEIAELFGVKPYVIHFIKVGKNWKHV